MTIARGLRERFLTGGRDSLPDYELLELLLFMAIPRIDTKALAKSLIDEFGSFADAIAAPVEQLRKAGVPEGTIAALKVVEAAALRLAKARVMGRPALLSWEALLVQHEIFGPQCRASPQHARHHTTRHRIFRNLRSLLHGRFKAAPADLPKTDAERLERVPDGVFQIEELALQIAPLTQQQAYPVAGLRLHMRLAEPARPHDVRDPQRIRRVGLVTLRTHRGAHMACL